MKKFLNADYTILDCGFWNAELKENEEDWNNGVMEYCNNGFKKLLFPTLQYSSTPVLQHSTVFLPQTRISRATMILHRNIHNLNNRR